MMNINSRAAEPKCIFKLKCSGNETICKKSLAGIEKFLKLQINKSVWGKVAGDEDYNYVIVVSIESLTKNKSDCIETVNFNLKLIRGETVLRPEKSFTQHFNLSFNEKPTKTIAKTRIEKNLVKGDIEDKQFNVASAIYDRVEEWINKIDKN